MDNGLELDILCDDEVAIPISIAGSTLTLSEIGAVVILQCLNHAADDHRPSLEKRLQSEDMAKAMLALKSTGVFSVSADGGTISVKIDLEKAGAQ